MGNKEWKKQPNMEAFLVKKKNEKRPRETAERTLGNCKSVLTIGSAAELYPGSQIKYWHQQIEIQWGCKFEAVDLLVNTPEVFLETLAKAAQI